MLLIVKALVLCFLLLQVEHFLCCGGGGGQTSSVVVSVVVPLFPSFSFLSVFIQVFCSLFNRIA